MPQIVFDRDAVPGGWFDPDAAGGWFDPEILEVGAGSAGSSALSGRAPARRWAAIGFAVLVLLSFAVGG